MTSGVLVALACPACIEALGSGVYEGFLWGMGLMMATPFILLAVVGGGLIYERRRVLQDEAERLLDEESASLTGVGHADRTGGTT